MYNTTVTLKKGEGRTLKAGGMWVFDNEISLTGKVYYQVDDDILSVNKLKSFKNIRELFALRDLRK